MSLFDLKNRIALVTGSSKGIGFALAQGLAAHGARIVLNGRDQSALEAARERLTVQGQHPDMSRFDVTDAEAVEAAITAVEAEIGPIDILINNAGMQHRAPLETFPVAMWQKLLETNVTSAFLVGQAVARRMIPRRRGRIVNICSVQSELARTNIAPYTATKGALKMLTKGMATDWGRHNIQVNGLAPGYFKTELNKALVEDAAFSAWLTARTPAGRWGDVEELVGAAVFLSSDAASFVNGTILYVDGGITSCL
ncbi:SDR family oxidoreductase [Lichenifustis flavocetrariae]|uniref:SDR family oxidoreductase n=1 Tax=Lichenifustis flavocetrariae TaxID=2949735 RepID=A0AA41Z861_9HYPH|nr:SDR family oxidoreductase [Lichenifustis flavocetrariae]MCW6511052.1 SDR family oxidoreductase [Lichenifustis flavocetrariae]